jgi:hypothetical protein
VLSNNQSKSDSELYVGGGRKGASALPVRRTEQPYRSLPEILARIGDFGDLHPWIVFLAIALVWLPAAVSHAITRPFWYDELFTVYLTRIADWGRLWEALRQGVDLQPPLLFAVTRAFSRFFGGNEFGMRAQGIASFGVLSMCIFSIARRRVGAWYAALAVCITLVSAAYQFSSEARPYAMLLAFAGLSLFFWIRYYEHGRRIGNLAGVTVAIALAVSSHYYGDFVVFPLLMGEAYEFYRSRKLDFRVMISIFLGLCPLPFFLPLIKGGIAAQGHKPWNPITETTVRDVYEVLLSPMVVPVTCAIVILALIYHRLEKGSVRPYSGPLTKELVAMAAYVIIPMPAIIVARFGSNMIHWRYLIPVVIGLVLISVTFLFWIANGRRTAAVIASMCCLTWFVYMHGRDYRRLISRPRPPQFTLPVPDGDLPIFVNSALDYFPAVHYAEPRLRDRLAYVVDPQTAARLVATDSVDKNIAAAASFFPFHVVSLDRLRNEYKEFLLYDGGMQFGWLLEELVDEGAVVKIYARDNDRFIYSIRMQDSTGRSDRHAGGR